MRIGQLKDVCANQDLYIVGSGSSSNVFPKEFFRGKICLALNDAFKMHPAIRPIAFMHHEYYSRSGNDVLDPIHPNFQNMKFAIVKATGKTKNDFIDWDNPFFYYYRHSHDIRKVWRLTKDSDTLYYTRAGCSLHGALQIAWIMGFRNVFVIGCDSMTLGGKHYAAYDKNKFRDDEVLKRGLKRNYDSYVYGTLVVQKFLESKGIRVFNLSSIVGFHMIEYQYRVQNDEIPIEAVYAAVEEIPGPAAP